MKEKPLISVLMGIYNCAETLEEAVQSVIDQTYDNWELILCDDCSTDNTYEIAERLAKKEPRIILLKNDKNLTLAPTLNKCFQMSSGEYIARMDGDDVCDNQRFEKELTILETNLELGLVSCQMNLFDAEGIYRTIHYLETPEKRNFPERSPFCHAGCMMRASVLKELGGYSEERSRQRVEDYDLWIRLYDYGYTGYNIQEPLYSMRDDRNAQKRRNLLNRINESRVKYQACRLFKLPIYYYLYVLIPIIKWLIPDFAYKLIHKYKKA